MNPWDHPLITKGMTTQLATRRARIAAGETPLGWKVGLGSPTSLEKLGIAAPAIGYLMQGAQLPSGATVSFKGYVRPVAEIEIAVRMARDLEGDATAADALAAIDNIRPAIEIADLDLVPAPDNLDAVLASVTKPALSISFSDDRRLAPKAACDDFVRRLPLAAMTRWHLTPQEIGLREADHFAHLRGAPELWRRIDHWLRQAV